MFRSSLSLKLTHMRLGPRPIYDFARTHGQGQRRRLEYFSSCEKFEIDSSPEPRKYFGASFLGLAFEF
jgi:hypothetical protein